MAPVEQEPAVRVAPASSAGTENPAVALRSAALQLREVADTIDRSARTLRDTTREPPDPKTVQVIVDAATNVRLTADALDYAAGGTGGSP